MTDWLSGQEILDGGKKIFELFDLVTKKGLQPYDEFGEKIPPPDISEKLIKKEELEDELKSQKDFLNQPLTKRKNLLIIRRKGDGIDDESLLKNTEEEIEIIDGELKKKENIHSWKGYKLPDPKEKKKEAKRIYELLKNSYYKVSDKEEIERKESQSQKITSEAIELIKDAKEELEMLHSAMKKDGYNPDIKNGTNPLQNNALTKFRENEEKFKYIKESFLEDKSLYWFRSKKQKECFIGRLLQNILEDRGFGWQSYQELYKLYPKTD